MTEWQGSQIFSRVLVNLNVSTVSMPDEFTKICNNECHLAKGKAQPIHKLEA